MSSMHAINTNIEVLHAATTKALQSLAQADNLSSVTSALDLLNTLATLSPTCREIIKDVTAISAEEILNDKVKSQQLKNKFAEILQDNVQQQLQADLDAAMATAKKQALEQQADYTQQLKESMQKLSPQRQAALDEYSHLAQKSIANRSDKAMFDTLFMIGHLFEILLNLKFIMPINEERYPVGYKLNFNDEDKYLEHLRRTYGNQAILANENPAQWSAPLLKT